MAIRKLISAKEASMHAATQRKVGRRVLQPPW